MALAVYGAHLSLVPQYMCVVLSRRFVRWQLQPSSRCLLMQPVHTEAALRLKRQPAALALALPSHQPLRLPQLPLLLLLPLCLRPCHHPLMFHRPLHILNQLLPLQRLLQPRLNAAARRLPLRRRLLLRVVQRRPVRLPCPHKRPSPQARALVMVQRLLHPPKRRPLLVSPRPCP